MFCSKDFMNRQRKYNNETLEQLWLSVINDTHECICQCETPYAHLLSALFPLGHQDRNKTITDILSRDYRARCQAGGLAGDGCGGEEKPTIHAAGENLREDKREDVTDADLIDFLAENAGENANTR